VESGKVKNEKDRDTGGARRELRPRTNAKQDEISIHDQDTAEIEIPEELRKDSNEKAA